VKVNFANCIREVSCPCGAKWGIGVNVFKAGSTYYPRCRATVPLKASVRAALKPAPVKRPRER